jgi:DNA modification methylase
MFKGNLPMSIMAADKTTRGEHDLGTGTYAKTSETYGKELNCKNAFDVSGQSCGNGALSVFPQNIGYALLMLYARPGQVVVDPFAGHNSRMELCVMAGFKYIGCDICAEFMEFNRNLSNKLFGEIELYECDSRSMTPVPDGIGDFTITSPPYWNREYYGPEQAQLGLNTSYSQFLDGMQQVARSNYRCLKPGSYCVWFVNDFRDNGKFYAYHVDTINLMVKAGFTFHDIVIVDLGYPIRAAFATQIVSSKIIPKRHEYALVFRRG